MATTEPPPFQEAARCVVCNCSFNTFRRRHHCRSCGRTLCNEHSSNQIALPQFGIYSNVRVCADCFNNSPSGKDVTQTFSDGVSRVTDGVSKLEIDATAASKAIPAAGNTLVSNFKECRCGMPLCICEAPAPSSNAFPQEAKSTPVITAQSNPKPKKPDTVSKNRSSGSSSKSSSTFNLGRTSNGASDRSQTNLKLMDRV